MSRAFCFLKIKLPSRDFCFCFFLCVGLLWIRGRDRGLHPEIWGEDGICFLKNALTFGLSGVWVTCGGYVNLLQTFSAWAYIHLFPFSSLPFLFFLTYSIVFCAIAATLVSREYEWLIPSLHARYATALLICLAPGLTEMMGSLCNINWMLFFWLGFLGLRSPGAKYQPWQILFALLATLSVGVSLLLVPLFLWRLFFCLRKGKAFCDKAAWAGDLTMLLIILGVNTWLISARLSESGQDRWAALSMGPLLKGYVTNLFWSLGFRPWLGETITNFITNPHQKFWDGLFRAFFVVITFLWIKKKKGDPRLLALLLFSLGCSGWLILHQLARPDANFFSQILTGHFWESRFSFPLGVCALVVWMGAIYPTHLFSARKSAALVFVLLNLIYSIPHFALPRYGEEPWWEREHETLYRSWKTGNPPSLLMHTYPEGWTVYFESTIGRPDKN